MTSPTPTPPRAPESYTWPLVAIVIAILPQVLVPEADRIGPPLLVPLVEGVAFLSMLVITAKPGPVPRRARPLILFLFSVLMVANAGAAIRLVILVLGNGTINGHDLTANRLLIAGAMVLLTNIVTFALLYWQLDGGGPAGRVADPAPLRDFQFPQMTSPHHAKLGWMPQFGDYLYVAYTNIVAFSPTDTMPLTVRAKALMTLQSLISLGVLVVVISRVINILPTN